MTAFVKTGSLSIPRYFTSPDMHPYDAIAWDTRTAHIAKADGTIVFEQENIEVPTFWSETASNVVASKYFRGQQGTPKREHSVKDMVDRVVHTIAQWGFQDNYFDTLIEAETFQAELSHIVVNQIATFNSPVWFNIGVPNVPQQAAACYLLSVEDSMDSILNWYREEAIVFKGGSGSGVNISALRGKNEFLSGGGQASGPLSFMKAADASAGVIKSGGKTRRAAKIVVMDVDHPDIIDFVWCKAYEEKKAGVLIAAGYDANIDGEAYGTVAHQNANYSVSVTHGFLHKALAYEVWCTRNRTNYEGQEHKAEDLLYQIANACWHCGDPGLFFYDTVNAWHTTPNLGPIKNPNPCSEVMRPPNDSCNLSSLNLLKFLQDNNTFDILAFQHTCAVMLTAQEILVGRADYPTPAITKNSHDYRTLGLGFNNLGALLMAKGLPYDSDEGRDYAASITALMTGTAYKRSAEMAILKGPFTGFEANKAPMIDVILKHSDALSTLTKTPITAAACEAWSDAFLLGDEYGFRNAQVTLLQPGGTVSLMMDCVTTGCEPDVGLVNYKALVGGGTIKKVNPLVGNALRTLGFLEWHINEVVEWVGKGGDIGNFVGNEHLPIFDCAFPSPSGRAINWQGHVKMVAALQPFLSGGISKTINMPSTSTVEDIQDAFLMAWRLGCKSIAIYRDGCKQTQVLTVKQPDALSPPVVASNGHATPLNDGKVPVPYSINDYFEDTAFYEQHVLDERGVETAYGRIAKGVAKLCDDVRVTLTPQRKRLPDTRPSITHKFSVGGQEGYFTVGLYDDGKPGELFVNIAKEGSTLGGVLDAWATMVSLSLQYSVPLSAITNKLRGARYEPMGFTIDSAIRQASSITDYIAHWLANRFGDGETLVETSAQPANIQELGTNPSTSPFSTFDDYGELCTECGGKVKRCGSCGVCTCCGNSTGCG